MLTQLDEIKLLLSLVTQACRLIAKLAAYLHELKKFPLQIWSQMDILSATGHASSMQWLSWHPLHGCGETPVANARGCGETTVANAQGCGETPVANARGCGETTVANARGCGETTVANARGCGEPPIANARGCLWSFWIKGVLIK